jgi:hypothetical protein
MAAPAAAHCPNPKCKAAVPAGKTKCQKCGFPLPAPKNLADEVLSRPWLIALLAASAFATLWAATRPSARPEPVPVAAAPEPEPPPPAPAADDAPLPMPAVPLPEAAASAPSAPEPAAAARQENAPLVPKTDGTWSGGPAVKRPDGAR